MSDDPGLLENYRILTKAYEALMTLYPVTAPISADTAMAIGYAAGCISKAKALVGRDIDQIRG